MLFGQNAISEDSYVKDPTNSLIVINHNVSDLNDAFPDVKTSINLGNESFDLLSPVPEFITGVGYKLDINGQIYTLYFSKLPIIEMTTVGQISDSPKVLGHFILKAPGSDIISSMIGVEYRGNHSQSYPKKSMEVEFWLDENGDETQDFSLLGLNEDDGINLQAMYNEKLRINSKTSNDLWQKIHPNVYYKDDEQDAKSGIIMKYADLFLNGEYRGVYALGEKVNRKFLKLKKNDGSEIKGELYKGDQYGGATMFTGLNPFNNNSELWDGYEYKYPKDIIQWDNLYNLVDFVVNENAETFNATYASKFDIDNIVDYFIFLNLVRATDNYAKNIYLAKYKKNAIYFYVPWDLDGTFGSIYDGSEENIVDDLIFNGLYARLWEEPNFRNKLASRWTDLRTGIVTKESIVELLSTNMQKLSASGIYEREAMVWNDYDFSPSIFDYKADWIGRRIDYLDSIMPALSTLDVSVKESTLSIYPNPSADFFYINGGNIKKADLKIIEFSGREVYSKLLGNIDGEIQVPLNNISDGIYFVIVKGDGVVKTARLIVKK